MKLTESQLFTIEALNRFERLEWPEWANYASMCCNGGYYWFWSDKPIDSGEMFSSAGMVDDVFIGSNHPDWRNSLITRAEFESVSGWVRHSNGDMPVDGDSMVQVQVKMHLNAVSPRFPASDFNWIDGDIEYWRYAKPRNQPEKATDITPAHSIETLIGQHKAARAATLEARRQLDSAETAERELMRDIEAWAESHGFDIRLLDESEEKQELVITDWRDLRVGDVIECLCDWEGESVKGKQFPVAGISDRDDDCLPIKIMVAGSSYPATWGYSFKFIRRP